MNTIFLSGRLGIDPQMNTTQSGKTVCNFTVAVSDGYGENRTTDWFRVVAWERQAENCAKFLNKGSKVIVQGRIKPREYENKQGQMVKTYEVIAHNVEFIGGQATQAEDQTTQQKAQATLDGIPNSFNASEEIPF